MQNRAPADALLLPSNYYIIKDIQDILLLEYALYMPRTTEKDKIFTILEKDVHVISAVNDQKLSPYLDIFKHYPENISAQTLGILTGFFRINDFSEESAYIVNFLSSVLKKEYYLNPKRPIENSFDAALRKVNLALSEIAKEGNVEWLGKVDGVVTILEKNNLHFTVCGNAKVFLFRNQYLTEISKDMAPEDSEPNPLKTFVNVSSGRLEKGDKIIICADDVFGVFSEEEIKKGAVRFPGDKFIQFIKTALVNKLSIVGTIVIDVFEREERVQPIREEQAPETYNVFSKKVFENKQPVPTGLNELLTQEEKKEYTDGKTGHIYIQEEQEETKKESAVHLFWIGVAERLSDAFSWLRNKTRRRAILTGRSLASATSAARERIRNRREEKQREKEEKKRQEKVDRQKAEQEQVARERAEHEQAERERIEREEREAQYREQKKETEEIKVPVASIPPAPSPSPSTEAPEENPFLARLKRRKTELEQEEREKESVVRKTESFFEKVTPHFGKIKNIFGLLSKKQKLYALGIIALILFVPFAYLKIQSALKSPAPTAEEAPAAPSTRDILSQEKNIVFLSNPETITDSSEPKEIFLLKEKLLIAGNNEIVAKNADGSVKRTSWPENFGNIQLATPMNDLNLALLYTDQNKVVSFLSATSEVRDNTITIPSGSTITGASAYLTYLYLLDSANSQIYRYPRAEGGFGAKTNWLKNEINLQNACCLAVDENIYLLQNNEVVKLFKGETQSLTIEKPANTPSFQNIFTNSDTQSIYLLDTGFGRIIKYSKEGVLLSQYFHEDIKNATGFTVDEKNNTAYLTTSESAISFNLQ